jgi:CheY-like chemotaxis protein
MAAGTVSMAFVDGGEFSAKIYLATAPSELHSGMNLEEPSFVQALLHELRNVLGPIRAATAVMRLRAGKEPGVAESLAIIEGQTESAVRLLNKVRDVVMLQNQALALERRTAALAEVVAAAAEPLRRRLAARRQALELRLPADPVSVLIDVERFRAAITEVLDNAARFSRDGGGIELDAAIEGADVLLTVRDHGAGIEADRLPTVLLPPWEKGAQRAGLGIGLYLASAIAAAHGGTLEVTSAGPGQGTRVSMRLPVVTSAATPGAGRAAAPARPGGGRSRPRVLVADDSDALRDTLGALLEASGFDARTVPDGEEALRETESWQPELVLLDFNMSPLSGFETARELRTRFGTAPMKLVLLSGTDLTPALIEGARRAGFDAWIDKAASVEEWEALLRRLRP